MKKLFAILPALIIAEFALGQTFFFEDFEGVTIPVIPAGWTTYGQPGSDLYMSGDNTTANGAGYFPVPAHTQFAYTNDDVCNCDKSADYLQLPKFDLTGISLITMSFESYIDPSFGASATTVEASTDSAIWGNVFTIPEDASQWISNSVDLSAYGNQASVWIRFKYNDQGAWLSGFALDDINVFEPPPDDAGVIAFDTPVTGCNLSGSESITIKVKNFGTAAQSSIPVSYRIDGGSPVNDTIIATINPGDTATFTFTATADLSIEGAYTFDSWTSLSTDSINNTNDSLKNYVIFNDCYCTPAHTNGCTGVYTDRVEFAGIDNSSGGTGCNGNANGFIYYNGDSAEVYQGGTFPVTLTPDGINPEGFGVWIDFNDDGDFADAGEFVFSSVPTLASVSGIINIPVSASLGATRMRIRCINDGSSTYTPTAGDSCNTQSYGETEDYPVIIQTPPANDVGVIVFDAPVTGCNLSVSESVTIEVKNFGTAAQSSIPVSYRINGGTPVNDTISTTINPGDTATFTFTVTADLSTDGDYSFDSWTSLGIDSYNTNDSLKNYIVSNECYCIPSSTNGCTLVYTDRVEFAGIDNSSGGTGCNGNANGYIYYNGDTAEVYQGRTFPVTLTPDGDNPEGFGVWIDFNDDGDFADTGEFVFSSGPTLTPVSGIINIPESASLGATRMRVRCINDGTSSYTPVTGDNCNTQPYGETEDYPVIIQIPPPNDVGVIVFDAPVTGSLTVSESVTIKVKNFGTAAQSSIPVSYRIDGGTPVNDTISTTINPGDTATFIFSATCDLSALGIYIFDAWTALGTDGDNTNDSLINYSVACIDSNDVGVITIDAPVSGCGLSASEIVTVRVKNFGSAAQSSIPVSYRVNGGAPVNDTILVIINPGDIVTYTFPTTYDLSIPGTYIFDSWTNLPGDSNTTNDSLINYSIESVIAIDTFPYLEDFESGDGSWTPGGTNSTWAYGSPSASFIPAAASDTNAWVTNLSGNYNDDELSYLTSPCVDFSSMPVDPGLRFSHIFKTETGYDRGWVEYSTDGGTTWTKLGTASSGGTNWYNDVANNWWTGNSGTSGVWRTAGHKLSGLAGEPEVIIRFVFSADYTVTDEGFGVDDIYISKPPPNDVGVIAIDAPTNGCGLSANESITIRVENFGIDTQSVIPVAYRVSGGLPVNDTIFATLIPGDTISFTFTTTTDLSVADSTYVFDAWTSLTNDSTNTNDRLINYFVFNNCYCIPTYTNGCAQVYTDRVEFAGIDNIPSGTGCNGNIAAYIYYKNDTGKVVKGYDHTITLTPNGFNWEGFGVWIDFNQNNSFADSGEFVFFSTPALSPVNGNISIPFTAVSGNTRMRIRCINNYTPVAADNCNNQSYGETEDYLLLISDPPPNDVGVTSFIGPVSGCGLTSNENITVQITNFGTNAQVNFPIAYILNGGSPVNEIIIDTVNFGQTLTYTFSQTVDITTTSLNTLVVYTSLSGDGNFNNDTISTDIFYGDIETYIVIKTGAWGYEVIWEILENSTGQVVGTGSGYSDNSAYVDTVCLNSFSNYTFNAYDSYGDGWNGGTYAVTRCDTSNAVINNGGNIPDNGQCCGYELETTETFFVYPCIANNLGVVSITQPVSSCELSSSETVTVQIFNFGDSAQVNVPVAYRLNGGSPVNETIADSIKSGEIFTYSFSTTADLSTFDIYTIDAWTALSNDSIKANDTLIGYVVIDADISLFPYKEDFETFTPGLPGILQNKWENDSSDNFDWYVNSGATPSLNTGPAGDHTNSSGVYMYARAAFNTPVDTAILYSPCINIGSLPNPRLGFWYHMYGSAMGNLYVEADTAGTWVQLASFSGQQQTASSDPWERSKIDLSGYTNLRQLRFIAITGIGSEGDIALDDVKIYTEHCNNSISDFDEEGIDCGGEDCMTVCPVTFQRAYGGVEEEYGYTAQQTNDGGYIAAGTTKSFGFAQTLSDIYVIKTDSLGDTLWTRTYGETGNDYVNSISQTVDNGFIIAGNTESFGVGANKNDFYLIKIDANGVVEWSKTFTNSEWSNDKCYSVIQTADSGYALVGKSSGSYVVKTDVTGNVQWGSKINNVDLQSIIQISTNEYVVSGSTSSDPYNAVLMKIYPLTDSIVWSKQYGGFGRDYGSSLEQTTDGGYIISGHSYSFGTGGNPVVYLIKTDSTGTLQWSKTYGGPEIDYGYSVKQTTDNGYIMSGETRSFGSWGRNVILIRTDSVGKLVWSRAFDAGYCYSGNGKYIQQTTDNGFLTIGSTKKIGTGTFQSSGSDLDEPDLYLIKTDPYGNTFLCYETDVTSSIGTTTPATTESVISVTISPIGASSDRTTISKTTATQTINLDYINITGFNKKDVSCFNGDDGYAAVQYTGGTDYFSYSWQKANPYYGWSYTADSAYSLKADSYFVTISAKNACTSSDTVVISQPDAYISIPYSTTPITCFGDNDGAIDIAVSGGTPPYTYSWSTGDTVPDINNLTSGYYYLEVRDFNNCSKTTYSNVSQPSPVSASYDITTVKCKSGNEGAINMTMIIGVPPYSYNWSTGDNSEDIDTLISGTYYITVTDSTNCIMQDSAFVYEPDSLTTIMSQQTTSCNGYCNGVATVTGSGGTMPYTYQWDDPSSQTNASAIGLCAITFNVTLTDINSCSTTDSITVTQPTILQANLSKTDVSCNGGGDGTATATPSGGTTPYTYLWNNGQNTSTIIGLFPGTFSVNVIDANGCTVPTLSISINEPDVLAASFSGTTDVICKGDSTGSTIVTPSGGTPPYTYLWDDPGSQTVSNVTGLPAGTYTVIITDSCGNTEDEIIVINEPFALSSSIYKTDVSCNGNIDGAADLSVSGGTTPYTYQWDDLGSSTTQDITGLAPGTYTVDITDACAIAITDTAVIYEPVVLTTTMSKIDVSCNGGGDGSATVTTSGGIPPYTYLWNIGQIASAISNLFPNTYLVNVSDANGCTAPTNNITISEPAALGLSFAVSDATCGNADGDATVIVSGGTTPYTFLWSNGGTGTTIAGLADGIYSITVTDTNGCTASDSTAIIIVAPLQPICIVTVDTTSTKNIVVWEKPVVTGIDSFRVYREIAGLGYTHIGSVLYDSLSEFVDTTNNINPQITSYRYKISVIDSCGNESVLSDYHETVHLQTIVDSNNVKMNWDNYEGFGFSYYRLLIDSTGTGSFTPIDSVTSSNTTYTDIDPPLGDLTYVIEVMHATGCEATIKAKNYNSSKSNTSSISTAFPLSAIVTTTNTTQGNCDGTATVTINGGIPPYTYQWDDPGSQNTQSATGLCQGVYIVTIADAMGDTTTASGTVNELGGALTVSAVATNATQGNCNGSATAIVSGGTSPYTYQWDDPYSQVTQTAVALCPGTYNVIVTDGEGNTETGSTTVGESGGILSVATSVTNATQGNCDGSATATASGGNLPYTYQWDGNTGSQTAQTAVSLCPGTYNVIVTDVDGKTGTASATVDEMTGIEILTGFQALSELKVYPNPNRGIFNLDIYLEEKEDVKIEIFDMRGKLIYSEHTGRIFGLFDKQIDLSNYQEGIYHLQVITDKAIINKKIIIE
ncbi:MAG: GEVED domain-containing protein [Bacteroidota bacterium]